MPEVEIRFTNGAAYERFMGPWTRAVGVQFLDWLSVPYGKRWLDVGCGTGIFTEMLVEAAQPSAVVAIDPAPAQIEFARGKPVAKNVEFRVADSQAMPFTDKSFDIAASALVINFIPDQAKALAEMQRVVKPGGWIAGYVWDFKGELNVLRYIMAPLRALKADLPRIPGTETSTLDALGTMFAQAGLAEVSTRAIEGTRTYASFDEYWDIFITNPTPQTAYVTALDEGARAAFKASMKGAMPVAADGTITFAARANAVKGRVRG